MVRPAHQPDRSVGIASTDLSALDLLRAKAVIEPWRVLKEQAALDAI